MSSAEPHLYGGRVPTDLALVREFNGEAVHARLVGLPREPDDADNRAYFATLQHDLKLANNAATLLEEALMELSMRAGYYRVKNDPRIGLLRDGMWVAMGGAGHILATGTTKESVITTALRTENHVIVRQVGAEEKKKRED